VKKIGGLYHGEKIFKEALLKKLIFIIVLSLMIIIPISAETPNDTLGQEKLSVGVSINPLGGFLGANPYFSVSLDFLKNSFYSIIDFKWQPFWFSMVGVSASFNYYKPGRKGGFYAGPFIELGYLPWIGFLGFGLNIGYRFNTASGVYFRTGANIGKYFLDFHSFYLDLDFDTFILQPNLTIGYAF